MQSESRRPGEGDGSECSSPANTAGCSTDLAAIPSLDPVETFFVGEGEAMRQKRKRLVRAGAAAIRRAERSNSALAHAILFRAAQISASWQFAHVTDEQLEDALIGVTGLFVAANAFERAEVAGD